MRGWVQGEGEGHTPPARAAVTLNWSGPVKQPSQTMVITMTTCLGRLYYDDDMFR